MRRKTSPVQLILTGGVMALALLWVLFPFYWALVNSIKQPADTFRPGAWVPFWQFQPTLEHWIAELSILETRHALLNSTVISLGAATLSVLLGTTAA